MSLITAGVRPDRPLQLEHDSCRDSGGRLRCLRVFKLISNIKVAFTLMGIEGIAQEIEMPFVRLTRLQAFCSTKLIASRVTISRTCRSTVTVKNCGMKSSKSQILVRSCRNQSLTHTSAGTLLHDCPKVLRRTVVCWKTRMIYKECYGLQLASN